MRNTLCLLAALSLFLCPPAMAQVKSRRTAAAANATAGYGPIVEKTQTIRLTPDLSHLTEGERRAVAKLLEAGQIFQKLYEEQRHAEAESSQVALAQLARRAGPRPETQNLLTLYR